MTPQESTSFTYPERWNSDDILALSFVKGMNSVLIRNAVHNCSSLEHCLSAPPTAALQKVIKGDLFSQERLQALQSTAQEYKRRCSELSISLVTYWESEYPTLLREILYPPTLLHVQGTLAVQDAVAVGIVGTRRCSQYGKYTTENFAQTFSRAGVVVVSGLANGIDTIAHQETVKAGGVTYAVIASGIDCISPFASRKLADSIVEHGGAIISEYKLGTKALPGFFPQRNRIISGISKATVVIESGLKGGSLITAQFCLDQERELFAVPGNINSERSKGTNDLIRQQLAVPALSPEQVLYELGIAHNEQTKEIPSFNDETEELIYNTLSAEPIQADELAEQLNVNVNDLLVALLMLEFRGHVRQLPGKMFIRT